jgi:biopolymer transport protein ExbD
LQEQLFALAAAPLSSLFLVLAIVPAVFPHHSHGVDLWLPQPTASWQQAFDECGDDRLIYLQLLPDGRARINETAVRKEELQDLITRIYETRDHEFLYFRADPRLTVQEVSAAIGPAQGSLPHLRLIAVTPEVERQSDRSHDFCTVSRRLWQRERAEQLAARRN